MDLIQIIKELGFPVAMVILFYFLFKNSNDKIISTLDKITSNNEILVDTNAELTKSINLKIDNLDEKIDKLL